MAIQGSYTPVANKLPPPPPPLREPDPLSGVMDGVIESPIERCPVCNVRTSRRFNGAPNPFAATPRATSAHTCGGSTMYHLVWRCGHCFCEWMDDGNRKG